MVLTYDHYCTRLSVIRNLFTETMKMIFSNPCSCEEAVLHSFFIRESNDAVSIYFDEEELEKPEIFRRKNTGNIQFIKEYVRERTNRENVIVENFVINNAEDGCIYEICWVFVCKCLEEQYGTLVLRSCFSQLAEAFNNIMMSGTEFCPETGKDDDVSGAWAEEIVQSVEGKIKEYLEGYFSPFKVDIVNALSGEYYEKSECRANMAFLPNRVADTFEAEDFLYRFKDIVFDSRNNRFLRKLLQMTQDNLYLVLEPDKDNKRFHVLGICDDDVLHCKVKTAEDAAIPFLIVKIVKHMMWDIFLGNYYIVTAQNGHYRINRSLQEEYLADKLKDYFGERCDEYKELIKNIILSTKQPHGTMLVIMPPEDAKDEAARLGNRNYGFAENSPRVLTNELNRLNAIDGCVIIDTDGKIHGIGMILDGLSVESGEPARGARYNSAKKYKYHDPESVSKASGQVMIVVVSEDGSVDIITF